MIEKMEVMLEGAYQAHRHQHGFSGIPGKSSELLRLPLKVWIMSIVLLPPSDED